MMFLLSNFALPYSRFFVIRSILLTNDGCGPGQAFRTQGHLGLSSCKRRRTTRDETHEETQRTIHTVNQIQRQLGGIDSPINTTRGPAEGNQHPDAVCGALGNGERLHHTLDENISDLACRQSENSLTQADTLPTDDGSHHSTDATFIGSHKGRPLLQGCLAGTSADSRGKDALSPMGQATTDSCPFQGNTLEQRRGDALTYRDQKLDGGSLDHYSLPQKAQGSRGCISADDPMADGLFQPSSPCSMEQLEETLLSRYLAAHRCKVQELHTSKESLGHSTIQTAEMKNDAGPNIGQYAVLFTWKVIRIMRNPGVLCYTNCIFQSLCWMALHTGHFDPTCWSDNGAIFTLMTKLDRAAVSIPSHEAFLTIMCNWCFHHNIRHQHDADEFLQHLLHSLKPLCWNAE